MSGELHALRHCALFSNHQIPEELPFRAIPHKALTLSGLDIAFMRCNHERCVSIAVHDLEPKRGHATAGTRSNSCEHPAVHVHPPKRGDMLLRMKGTRLVSDPRGSGRKLPGPSAPGVHGDFQPCIRTGERDPSCAQDI